MVKYATALRLGTAETEAILRRFTRSNVQHPTYRALAELGKAIKTIFLCRYLRDEALRRDPAGPQERVLERHASRLRKIVCYSCLHECLDRPTLV
jgi:TnpA family transposase